MFGAAIAFAAACWLLTAPAAAQVPDSTATRSPSQAGLQRRAEIDGPIELALAAAAPDAVPAFQQATVAMDRGDYAQSERLFREVLQRAPAFVPALRRLGFVLVGAGRPAEGQALGEQALARDRSWDNLYGLAQMLAVASPGKQVSFNDYNRAILLLREAITTNTDRGESRDLEALAQVSLAAGRLDSFNDALDRLQNAFPERG